MAQSKEIAEAYLEPVDVENGECIVYDSEGMVLRARVEQGRIRMRTRLEDGEDESIYADELRWKIVDFFRRLARQSGEEIGDVVDLTLPALIERLSRSALVAGLIRR